MVEEDPQELSQALEREASELERQSQEVEGAVERARDDWQRKRRDENVPGAVPPEDAESAPDDGESDDPGRAEDP